jgi:hypothetical protein
MIFTGIFLILALVFYMVLSKNAELPNPDWDNFIENSDGVLKFIGKAAKPISGSNLLKKSTESTAQYRNIMKKLHLGGAFLGLLEIYVAVQFFSIIVGSVIVIYSIFALESGLYKILGGMSALIVIIYPYNYLNSKAIAKSEIINSELPDFVELLVMVLPSMSVPQSLSFTAENSEGLISFEIKELVKTLTTRKVSEEEAFNLTAERIGTDDGRQFIDILKDAYLEGTKSVDAVSNLAENMRKASFQRQRATLKKLPVKLTLLFALHFMPLLLALTFLPVVYSLAGVSK